MSLLSNASARGPIDALKTEVVIPSRAKNWAELRRVTSGTRKVQNYPFAFGPGFKVYTHPLPIVGSRRQGLRTRQTAMVRGIKNRDHRHARAIEVLGTGVAFKAISSFRLDRDGLRYLVSVGFVGLLKVETQTIPAVMRSFVNINAQLWTRNNGPAKGLYAGR